MVKIISLTQGKVALVDDEDYEELNKNKWCAWKNSDGTFYAVRGVRKNKKMIIFRMHREIMNAKHGEEVDHINHDGLDNRRCNLRICTHSQNLRNCKQHKNNTSGLRGVSWDIRANKWRGHICKNNKTIYLGLFSDKIEAGHMVDQYAMELFGEFAVLNFPDDVEVEK